MPMVKERKEGLKLFMWVALAMLLHYTALVTGQLLVSTVFAAKDLASGVLTYDLTGEIYYQGEALLESEAYLNRYGYGTSAYATIIAVPIVLIGLFIFSKIQKKPFTQTLSINRFPVVPSLLSLVIGLAIYFPAAYIVANTFLNNLSPETGEATQIMFAQTPYWVLFFSTALCAPIIEELTFRGFVFSQVQGLAQSWLESLQQSCEEIKNELPDDADGEMKQRAVQERMEKIKRRCPIYVIVAQALLFGAFHMNLQQFIYATALGLLFGLMRHYTKSVWPSVLAHIGFNAFSVGLYGLQLHPEWKITQVLSEMSDTTLLLITAVVFAVALFLFELVVKNPGKSGGKTSQNP